MYVHRRRGYVYTLPLRHQRITMFSTDVFVILKYIKLIISKGVRPFMFYIHHYNNLKRI